MARPQKYVAGEALATVTEIFRASGYAATSIGDLQVATGMGRQSLYNAFGDKETLFLRVLSDYCGQLVQTFQNTLDANAQVPVGFGLLLDEVIAEAIADKGERGCLMVTAASELAARHEGVREVIGSAEKSIEDTFTAAIERGQKAGQIPSNKNPRKLAILLHNCIIGLRIRARYAPSRITLKAIANETLQALR